MQDQGAPIEAGDDVPVILRTPTKMPKYGGLTQSDTSDNVIPHFGGAPKPDFSGLEEVALLDPRQKRPLGSHGYKQHEYRVSGIEPKLGLNSNTKDVRAFCYKLNLKTKSCGLDTELYVRSMGEPDKVVNVIQKRNEVTLDHVRESMKEFQTHWDSYARQADLEATEMLRNSMEDDLLTQVVARCSEDGSDPTAVMFTCALTMLVDQSVEDVERDKVKIRELSPLDFPGQNVAAYVSNILLLVSNIGLMWDWILILPIVRALTKPTVEVFTSRYNPMVLTAVDCLHHIQSLPKPKKNAFMEKAGFAVREFLTSAERSYNSLVNNGHWPPALTVTDSTQVPKMKIPSAKIGAVGNEPTPDQQAWMMKEIQSKTDKKVNELRKKDKERAGNHPNGRRNRRQQKWREVAPKSGESTTKTVDGVTFHWCTRCNKGNGLWNRHTTDQHDPDAFKKNRNSKQTNSSPSVEANQADCGVPFFQI